MNVKALKYCRLTLLINSACVDDDVLKTNYTESELLSGPSLVPVQPIFSCSHTRDDENEQSRECFEYNDNIGSLFHPSKSIEDVCFSINSLTNAIKYSSHVL